MNNKLRQFYKISALSFSIVYLSYLSIGILTFLPSKYNLNLIYSSVNLFEVLTIGLFFILITIDAYSLKTDKGKIYAIIFLLFLGVLLIFPQFLRMNLMFLIIYSYFRTHGSRLDIPLSYITIGYFIQYFIFAWRMPALILLAYAFLLYSWIKFLKECRYRF